MFHIELMVFKKCKWSIVNFEVLIVRHPLQLAVRADIVHYMIFQFSEHYTDTDRDNVILITYLTII